MKTVKKIILLFTILVSIPNIYAQTDILPVENWMELTEQPGAVYLKDVNHVLDKFTGEWLYTDATHYFKIKFYKIEHAQVELWKPGHYDEFDELRSFMLYKELQGGVWVTVYNSYPASYTNADLQSTYYNFMTSICGNLVDKSNLNKIILHHYEPVPPCSRVNSRDNDVLYSTAGGQETLTWFSDYRFLGSHIIEPCPDNTTPNPQYNYKIPENMVMVKL